MKNQFLGDSKDSFKWDYHDALMSALGFDVLQIVPMLTQDDAGSHGASATSLYPARDEILELCRDLRASRDIRLITDMPTRTGAAYSVDLHEPARYFTRPHGGEYFQALPRNPDVLVFADPDNGFEPGGSCRERHLAYAEVETILAQLSKQSMLSVFHHFRRVKFSEDFGRIRGRLDGHATTALHWHSVMFVSISRSKRMIERVRSFNRDYATTRPVRVIE